jgi:succinoglycan biosynthesis protein ExoM
MVHLFTHGEAPAMTNTTPVDISICICTFKRPELLNDLLHALTQQATAHLHIEVVVVDNDPRRSASAVLQQWQTQLPFPLTALSETTPNIAIARNAAVAAAQGTWVLFIDDDETPDPDWIVSMVQTQARYNADAVFGPVLPRYNDETPDWVKKGNFFYRRRFNTGTVITTQDARTGNVLIRRSCLTAMHGPFDTSFGRTGAEDTMLFRDMIAQGAVLVWCDEATVSEEVPASRANLPWLVKRSYRLGQTYVLSETARITGIPYAKRALYLGSRALVQLGIAVVLTVAVLPFSRITAIRWLRTSSAQCGKLSALAGHRYHEYGH